MLNEKQKCVVDSDDDFRAIIAGAGTGKTHTLVEMIKRDSSIYDVKKFACITFTRNGANELKERLIKNNVNTDGMYIGTIHGFCLHMLDKYYKYIGWQKDFLIFDEKDSEDIYNHVIDENPNLKPDKMPLKKALEDNRYRDSILKEYDCVMQMLNAIDYSMLVTKTSELLDSTEHVKDEYRYFYIDEYQDTYNAQLELIMKINPDRLSVIGDPDQSIFEWNNAKPEYLVNIDRYFPGIKIFILNDNYRSTLQIIEASNRLINHNQNRIKKDLISYRQGNEISIFMDETQKAEVDRIHSVLQEPYTDYAIICRKNATAEYIAKELAFKKVPVQLIASNSNIFKQPTIKDLIKIFRSAVSDDNYSWYLLFKYFSKVDTGMIKSFINSGVSAKEVGRTLPGCSELIDTMDGLISSLNSDYAFYFVSNFIRRFKLVDYFKDMYLDNKVHLLNEFLAEVKAWQVREESRGHSINIKEFLRWVMLLDIQDSLSKKNDAVKIMTVHGSKGLEFNKVIVPFVVEKEFPASKGEIEEERRLMYVAMTRAKNELYLMYPLQRLSHINIPMATKSSRFLLEI